MKQILFHSFSEDHTEWLKSFCDYFQLYEEVVVSYFDEVNN